MINNIVPLKREINVYHREYYRSRQFGKPQNLEQKIQIGAPNPHSINERFSFNQFILVFLVTIIPPKA